MYQMTPFKHYFYYRNDKLDGIITKRQASSDNKNAFPRTLQSLRSNKIIIWI